MDFLKPQYPSEANLQAEFYHQCHTVHLFPYLEYSHQGCRFDCVVVDNGEIIAIIEVKRLNEAESTKTQKQIEKYNYFSDNTPVFLLVRKDDIHKIIAKIQQIRKKHRKKNGKNRT